MKTFEVKFAYSGYQAIQVQAKDGLDAYDKAKERAGEGLFGLEADPEMQAAFLDTMNRWQDADDISEVENG